MPWLEILLLKSLLALKGSLRVQSRSRQFASLGDTLNNLVINTTGNTQRDVRQRTAAIVTTADAAVHAHISAALGRVGLANATNLAGFSPSQLPHPSLARFAVLGRASVWADASAKATYFNATSAIYLLVPPAAQRASPLPLQPLRRRGTGHSESEIPGLVGALSELRSAVVKRFSEGLNMSLVSTAALTPLDLDGPRCIHQRKQCYGNNNDANYLQSSTGYLEEDAAAVLVGSSCVENRKCTYTNIGLYHAHPTTATNTSVDHRRFAGSAASYAPSLPAGLADRAFAYTIARDCRAIGPFCVELPRSAQEWSLIYRTYLEPATRTGPALDELIIPQILRFRRRSW